MEAEEAGVVWPHTADQPLQSSTQVRCKGQMKNEQLYLRQISSFGGSIFYFPHMLSSSQQAGAWEACDYDVGHIEFTQFISSLQA